MNATSTKYALISALAAATAFSACAPPRHNRNLVQAEHGISQPSDTLIHSRTTERGTVLTIPGVVFDVDAAEVQASAQRELTAIAAYLADHRDQPVLIEGHTDSIGTAAYNRELSLRRGTAVEAFFLKHGVDPERIEVRGRGEDQPVASNATVAGRRQNRRVEVLVGDGERNKTARTEKRVIESRGR